MDASDSPNDQIDAPSKMISFNKNCPGTTAESRIRQSVLRSRSESRNSSAEANTFIANPTDLIKRCRDSRTESLSSIIEIWEVYSRRVLLKILLPPFPMRNLAILSYTYTFVYVGLSPARLL